MGVARALYGLHGSHNLAVYPVLFCLDLLYVCERIFGCRYFWFRGTVRMYGILRMLRFSVPDLRSRGTFGVPRYVQSTDHLTYGGIARPKVTWPLLEKVPVLPVTEIPLSPLSSSVLTPLLYLRVMPQMRDLRSVGSKLKIVLDPRGDQEGVLTKLKDCEKKRFHRGKSTFFCKYLLRW